jgi:hypothetical protein
MNKGTVSGSQPKRLCFISDEQEMIFRSLLRMHMGDSNPDEV